MLKMVPVFGLVVILILLTACGATPTAVVVAGPPTATPAPIKTPMPEPSATPTNEAETPTSKVATEEPTAVIAEPTEVIEEPTPPEEPITAPTEETDWGTVEGKTEDNLTYLGNPNAPVTIIDYSDFL